METLPAGAAALVVGTREGVLGDGASIQRGGPRVIGDASRPAGVAGDQIAMQRAVLGVQSLLGKCGSVGEEKSGDPASVVCRSLS